MLEQALWFRKKMTVRYKKEILKERGGQKGWWFKIWQPETVTLDKEGSVKKVDLENVDNAILANDADIWVLKPGDKWHGFDIPQGESILLDPVKVTVLTPGINEEGVLLDDGIPAPIVARFLMDDLIVPEKVGFYNLLFLFSSGVTKAKSQRLINGFAEFKRLYEANAVLEKVFPELVKEFPDKYKNLGLRDLCRDMHAFFKSEDILALMRETYLLVQPQAMLPADAYEHIVRGNVEYVPLDKLQGRTSAVILAPYPPGIPVVMPGEKFTPQTRKIIDYFIMTEEIDNRFPGFEIEIHGMNVKNVSGKNTCYVLCVK
jgi:lysine decarboxylase/arginine decarboxylase